MRILRVTYSHIMIVVLIALVSFVASAFSVESDRDGVVPAPLKESDAATQARVREAYGKLPLSFEANQGQTDPKVKFLSRGEGYTLFLTQTEAVLVLKRGPGAQGHGSEETLKDTAVPPPAPSSELSAVLRMGIVGANPAPHVAGTEELPGKSNYFNGNNPKKWQTDIPHYARIKYQEVYPGIDMVYYGNQRQLEYDFIVAAGADPKKIRLGFNGADQLEISPEGDLILETKGGEVRLQRPIAYQERNGTRQPVQASYIKMGESEIAFQVMSYDAKRPLIIDPILSYSTFLGGTGSDNGHSIAVDGLGNAYVTGFTFLADYPTTPGTFDASFDSGVDAFVTKLNPAGSTLLYSTFLGGNGSDHGFGIAVDGIGNAYVTGRTVSSDFPTTPGVLDTTLGGSGDAFVTKLNSAGSALLHSTFLGGSGSEFGYGIAIDTLGNAYVTGFTDSAVFPTTPGAYDVTFGGGFDAFVTKLNSAGSALLYSTFLGGNAFEEGRGIAVDASNNAYVTGQTGSSDFPTTPGVLDATLGGSGDTFVTKLNSAGSALLYSTFLGGSSLDEGFGIAVDALGNAYVVGFTNSGDFPITSGVFDALFGGSRDAFVTKLNSAGSALLYSTFLGGNGFDEGHGIAIDTLGNAYVVGETDSAAFPITPGAFDATLGGFDAFVTKLNAAGSALLYSTFLGGNGSDTGHGIAVDPVGNAYITGWTVSSDFPRTPGVFDTTFGGDRDIFVVKVEEAKLTSIAVTPSNSTINVGQTQLFTATGTFNDGSTAVLTGGLGLWDSKASMPTARRQVAGGVVNNIFYTVGGGASLDKVEAYDPVLNNWTIKAPMPTPRRSVSVGVVNGILYAIGGYDNSGMVTSAVEAYNPVTNTWTTKAPMPTARGNFGLGIVNGIVYAVGGDTNSSAGLTTVEAYDPVTDTWTSKNPIPSATSGPGVAVVNDILYLIGGWSNADAVTTVESYDPATNTWTAKASMPTARFWLGVEMVNGVIYAVGGSNGSVSVANVEAYNPTTDAWSSLSSMPATRESFAIGVINGVLYAAGGARNFGISLDTHEIYTPPQVTWSSNDANVAAISGTGLATGLSPGLTTITATSGSISGSTTLTVVSPTSTLSVGLIGVNGGSGTVTSNPTGINCGGTCSASFTNGTFVSLTATPAVGSVFSGWSGACSGIGTCIITMDANKSVTATFTLNTYTLSLLTAGTGSGTVTGAGTYDYGSTVTVTATAAVGSTFSGWSGPDAAECGTGSILMNANKTCTANFTLNQYTLTVTTTGTGSGTTLGGGTYNYGQTVVVSATSSTGSTFNGWSGLNATECSSGSVLVDGNKSCTAIFTLNTHTLTLTTAGTGAGTVAGAGTYNYGSTVAVTATASAGSTFAGWSGSNGTECATGSVSIIANKNCIATFNLSDVLGPVTANVSMTPNPAKINTSLSLTASVDDSATGGLQIVSAEYNIDNGSYIPLVATDGIFDSVTENVTIAVPAFPEAGVHNICVRGTDAVGNVGVVECLFLAVYDPAGGFVTGGGWIGSPLNACHLTPGCENTTGKANFGFVSKYKKGANVPTGETEFQFKAGNLNFHSSVYEWLVVAGARAQFKGSGTINGGGAYGFMLTAIDGQVSGGGGNDKFRIKIWNKNSGGVVYDNQVSGNAGDDANPTTIIGGGSIIIHK